MTIASFCHDLLLTDGPLPLETLAERASAAGVTQARDPESSVRSAIAHAEVLLPDGRWTTPLQLLEGRILTARRLPVHDDVWHDGGPDGTEYDVAPLHRALRSGPVPLAGGGQLRRRNTYSTSWSAPRGWPDLDVGSDELVGLRIREGALHLEVVPVTLELHAEGERLAAALGHLSRGRSYWPTDDLTTTLWSRLATQADLLLRPAPPLSRCLPDLAAELRARREERRRQASIWTLTLELPAELQSVAIRAAHRSNALLPEWMGDLVTRRLRALDSELDPAFGQDDDEWPEEDWLDEEYGQVLRLPRQP